MDAESICCFSDLRWLAMPRSVSRDCCCAAIVGRQRIADRCCYLPRNELGTPNEARREPTTTTTTNKTVELLEPLQALVVMGVIRLAATLARCPTL